MANKNYNTRVQFKHDTEENWKKANGFVPLNKELIIYDKDENYDYERFKLGDGVTNVNDLEFINKNITSDGAVTASEFNTGYLTVHPENESSVLIPFIHNDIAFLTTKGYSVSAYTTTDVDYTIMDKLTTVKAFTSNIANLFNGSPDYCYFALNSTSDVLVIDMNLPKHFAYNTQFYIDFGKKAWGFKDIKVYVMNSLTESMYRLVGSQVKNSSHHRFLFTDRTTNAEGTSVQGFNRMRIVLKNPSGTNCRISEIGLINYLSTGAANIYIPKNGATDILGNLIPYHNKQRDLGSASKLWNRIYGNEVYGGTITASGNFIGNLTGLASSAVADEQGNNITNTYASKKEIGEKILHVTPEMYGAVGDGVTDDSAAIQQAISSGLPVSFANKTYLCKDIITKNVENVVLRGSGETIIRWNIITTADLRPFAGMISDDDYNSASYLGKGEIYIENIIFDGNSDKIVDFTGEESFGLCVFYARDKVTIKNCTFRNSHADGFMIRGLKDKISVSNCKFENIGLYQSSDGTRNGLTLTRNYHDRGTGSTVSNEGSIISVIENCTFNNIADECVRVDGFSNFSINNCYFKDIGHQIIESGHTTDKTDYVYEIRNSVGENIAHGIYTSGADGGGVFEHKGHVYVINSIFKNMCWTGCPAKFKRPVNSILVNGYTTGIKPDILVENCHFSSETEKSNFIDQDTKHMISGENVTLRNTKIDYMYINVEQFLPCFNSLSVTDCEIFIHSTNSTYITNILSDGAKIMYKNTTINKDSDLYSFIRCVQNDATIIIEKCTFNCGGYVGILFPQAVTGSIIRVIENTFNGVLTGRFLHSNIEGGVANVVYFVGNYFPKNFCAWGSLSNITGSLDVKKNNSSMNV